MNDFIFQTLDTDLGAPGRVKLAREIRAKVKGIGTGIDSTESWATDAQIPVAKYNFACAYLDGVIYLFGGGASPSDTVYAYTIATDSWTTKTACPNNMDLGTATALNGKIYVIAPILHGADGDTKTYEFDPAGAGTWTVKTNAVTGSTLGNSSSVTDGTYIYLLGGIANASQKWCKRYLPSTDIWANMTDAPSIRSAAIAEYHDGKIYFIGGLNDVIYLTTMAIYDIATGTWSTPSAILNNASAYAASCIVGTCIYIFGGHDGANLSLIQKYSISLSSFSTDAVALPSARQSFRAAYDGTKVHMLGGSTTSQQNISRNLSTSTTIATIKLFCDDVLKFTGTLATDGTLNPKINKFRLPPSCRGESFYMVITGNAGVSMQVYDAAITEFKLRPPGAG